MRVEGTTIIHIRGDTGTLVVKLKDADGVAQPLLPGDKVYFTVKESTNTTTKILQKIVTTFVDGNAEIELTPTDTAALRVKDYYYDVQVNVAVPPAVMTVIPPSIFRLAPEVTYE